MIAKSKIAQLRKREQKERKFYVLEELHTFPNVNYLEKIRNTEREIGISFSRGKSVKIIINSKINKITGIQL